MKQLFDKISAACSKSITTTYSTSFSLGIKFLGRHMHAPIYAIYGFVRLADEIVDTFHEYDKAALLGELRNETWKAIERGISTNPVLQSFQTVVHKYGIDREHIECFLDSMEADLGVSSHTRDSYDKYILGSAEVVGLMCLRVFTEGNTKLYEDLKPAAMKLGAAFQKVNFLRDINADYNQLGRTYFPGVNFRHFSAWEKQQIQQEIEADFAEALAGIRKLPASSRGGVYLAYYYYRELFNKITKVAPEKIMNTRVRIPDHKKLALMFQSAVRLQLNML
jgi:phytoene/squalene synthetase